MSLARRIGEHRPAAILALLVVLSLASLASGARGGPVAGGVRVAVGVASVPFLAVFNKVEAGISYTTGLFLDYDGAREEVAALQRRLAVLLERVARREELLYENTRLREMMAFERSEPRLILLPAEVIQHAEGMLTIDRGSLHGMRASMCVITGEGVIGMITRVNPLTSSVATLQNADCVVDAMVKRNRVRGRVRGTGNDLNRICSMNYIDLKDEVRPGDLIVTSPDSVFPSGLPIGIVTAVHSEGTLSQVAEVVPAADAFRADEVFVLLGADLEWEELAGGPAADVSPRPGLELGDTRTLQERFAP